MEGLAADESTCIDDDTLLKWLTLMRLLGWFSGASRELLRPDKGADELLNDGLAESSRLGAVKLAQARSAAQVDLTACRGLGIGIVPLSHPSYPASLKQTVGCPVVLFALGDLSAITRPSVAIVGSRRPTPAGRNLAGEFGSDLAGAGLTVVSGLAYGIDAAAHAGAIRADGLTVAVCGCGLDRVYPRAHTRLSEQICANGALLSEFPPGVPPRSVNFPRRNRVISGLSAGVIVVEAARRSGSLITARLAAEQGRDVMAVPGWPRSKASSGTNFLIREGATLVRDSVDVLEAVGPQLQPLEVEDLNIKPVEPGECASAVGGLAPIDVAAVEALTAMPTPHPPSTVDKDEHIVLDALADGPQDIDTITLRTHFTAAQVRVIAQALELSGLLERVPGGRFARLWSDG